MDRTRLDEAIQKIREYTSIHPELQVAHHFTFDLPLDKYAGKPEIVVMGINPGEAETGRREHFPMEETWNYDFRHGTKRNRSSKNWFDNATFFANGRPVVFTELFFWSSKDQDEFNRRYRGLWDSPHLKFCISMNKVLIEEYQPQMVIFPGLGHGEGAAKIFGLRHVRTVSREGRRMVEHYQDRYRPWFFTRHWSGAFGFSQAQKLMIKEYIHAQKLR